MRHNPPVFFRPEDLADAHAACVADDPAWAGRLDHALHLLEQRNYVRLEWDADVLVFSAVTGNTYDVTVETCTCAAFTKPSAAGDEPKKCKHRAAHRILSRIRDDAKSARVAAMQQDMDSAQLPAFLGA